MSKSLIVLGVLGLALAGGGAYIAFHNPELPQQISEQLETVEPQAPLVEPVVSAKATPWAKVDVLQDPAWDPLDRVEVRKYLKALDTAGSAPDHVQALYVLANSAAKFKANGFLARYEEDKDEYKNLWWDELVYEAASAALARLHSDYNDVHMVFRKLSNNIQQYTIDYFRKYPKARSTYLQYRYAVLNKLPKTTAYLQEQMPSLVTALIQQYLTSKWAKQLYRQEELDKLNDAFMRFVPPCVVFTTPSVSRCTASILAFAEQKYAGNERLPEYAYISELTDALGAKIDVETEIDHVYAESHYQNIAFNFKLLSQHRIDFYKEEALVQKGIAGNIIDANALWEHELKEMNRNSKSYEAFEKSLVEVKAADGSVTYKVKKGK